MKYILYFRVSTKGQGESGLGLEAQRQFLDHYIKADEVVQSFTEIASAKNYKCKSRPLLCEAIELCKTHGYTLAVAKIDRLSRNLMDALTIYEDLKGRIYSCDIPSQDGRIDKFMLSMFIAFAERERELISLRIKGAFKARNKKEWRKGNPRFDDARRKAAIGVRLRKSDNENNIRAKELICQYKAEGFGLQKICDLLNEKKFRTAKGKKFNPIQVSRLTCDEADKT